MNQKLCLFLPLPIHIVHIVTPVALVNHTPVYFIQLTQVIEPFCKPKLDHGRLENTNRKLAIPTVLNGGN